MRGRFSTSSCTAIFDDLAARAYARRIGLPFIGTLGLVLRAKERGLLRTIAEPLEWLRRGLYLSDALIARVLQQAGEG